MNYNEAAGMLAEYRNQIAGIREKMRNAQASIEPEEVKDYEFVTPQGPAFYSLRRQGHSIHHPQYGH
jgi:hypothetical protein